MFSDGSSILIDVLKIVSGKVENVRVWRRFLIVLVVAFIAAGCGGERTGEESSDDSPIDSGETTGGIVASADETQDFTPLVGAVPHAPIPFAGSDGRTHLVYEVEATNFTSGETTIEQLDAVDANTGDVVATLDADEVADRLQPAGLRDTADAFDASMAASIFLHLTFEGPDAVPERIIHSLSVTAEAAPPDQQQVTQEVAPTEVDRRDVLAVGPPLMGSNYLAADSCCDATRHTRATLPIDGSVWLAQRYAVDYEQLDDEGRIYDGEQEDLDAYTVYGKEAIAVADGTVVKVVDDLPEQVPGVFPEGISVEEADGNSVVLDLGGGNYALYAHFQPDSIRVEEGDRVERGDVLALVGNSGNSVAPHLHFHMMSGPLSLASNGVPYVVDSFTVTGQSAGTEAFDEAEAEGNPLEVTALDPAETVTDAMPLDQFVVDFD